MSDRTTVDDVIRALTRPFIEDRDEILILIAGMGLGFMLGILAALEIGVIEYQAVEPEPVDNFENFLRTVNP